MKIKKIQSQGEYCYPATIAAAVKDANFLDEDNKVMTQGAINLFLHAETDEKSNKISVQNMTETTATISPNTFYVWGEVTDLDITLEEPEDSTIYNEYMFLFTSGSTATTLSLPATITWYLDNNTISSNKTYQISIVNNLAILGEF